mmetsp:Transcript_38030/g.74481  ORF Transcript_38030/g.74481 Transcript_38030/m.74481 type:complete len:316 (-) Transcript_38030:1017-1964(-)
MFGTADGGGRRFEIGDAPAVRYVDAFDNPFRVRVFRHVIVGEQLLSRSRIHKHLGLAKVFWNPRISNNLHNPKKSIERHARNEYRVRLRERGLLQLPDLITLACPSFRPLEPAPHAPHARDAQKVLVISRRDHREYLLDAANVVGVGAVDAPPQPVGPRRLTRLHAGAAPVRVVVVPPDELVGEPARVRLSDEHGHIDGCVGTVVSVSLLGDEGCLLRRDGARGHVVPLVHLAAPPEEFEGTVGRGIDGAAGGVEGDVGFLDPSPGNRVARGELSGGDESFDHTRLRLFKSFETAFGSALFSIFIPRDYLPGGCS